MGNRALLPIEYVANACFQLLDTCSDQGGQRCLGRFGIVIGDGDGIPLGGNLLMLFADQTLVHHEAIASQLCHPYPNVNRVRIGDGEAKATVN